MNFKDYAHNIQFRFVQPDTRLFSFGFDRISQRLKVGVWFEMLNTILPENESAMKNRLRDMCFVPRMSTYAIGAMINKAVREMPASHVFVNVGVWRGFTLLSGMAGNASKTCIGVDNFSEFGDPRTDFLEQFEKYRGPRHHFYEMDYVDYFTRIHDSPIGVFIYDGNHSYKNQLRALELAEPYFSDDCIILIDDVNYAHVRRANRDFMAKSPRQYRTVLHQETYCNSHPTFWNGITIIQRVGCP